MSTPCSRAGRRASAKSSRPQRTPARGSRRGCSGGRGCRSIFRPLCDWAHRVGIHLASAATRWSAHWNDVADFAVTPDSTPFRPPRSRRPPCRSRPEQHLAFLDLLASFFFHETSLPFRAISSAGMTTLFGTSDPLRPFFALGTSPSRPRRPSCDRIGWRFGLTHERQLPTDRHERRSGDEHLRRESRDRPCPVAVTTISSSIRAALVPSWSARTFRARTPCRLDP